VQSLAWVKHTEKHFNTFGQAFRKDNAMNKKMSVQDYETAIMEFAKAKEVLSTMTELSSRLNCCMPELNSRNKLPKQFTAQIYALNQLLDTLWDSLDSDLVTLRKTQND
jgi:hypothetical protein